MSIENTRAISIRQPWAELILQGAKTIEVRSWATSYRGVLWLHAGLGKDDELDRHFGLSGLFRGGYVGSFELSGLVPFDEERWENWRPKHLNTGQYRPNTFAWIVSVPLRFEVPIPGPGKLSLFEPALELKPRLISAYQKSTSASP
jgi:hypothetical protein